MKEMGNLTADPKEGKIRNRVLTFNRVWNQIFNTEKDPY